MLLKNRRKMDSDLTNMSNNLPNFDNIWLMPILYRPSMYLFSFPSKKE